MSARSEFHVRKGSLFVIATILASGLIADAQEPISRPALEFNGASIKPVKEPRIFGYEVMDNGNVSVLGFSVDVLIRDAYDIKHLKQIKGGPAWLSTEHFEVRAIPAQEATRDQIPQMIQSLLIDRFKLRAHWEIRDEPVYSLELARQDGTLKAGLKRSKADCWAFWETGGKGDAPGAPRDEKGQPICFYSGMQVGGRVHMGGLPWSDLFTRLASEAEFFGGLDRPVVDNTGFSGNYEIHLEFRRDYGGLPDTLTELTLPSVKDAVQEQLGLKLVPKMEPWKVLVIDSVERPTPD